MYWTDEALKNLYIFGDNNKQAAETIFTLQYKLKKIQLILDEKNIKLKFAK